MYQLVRHYLDPKFVQVNPAERLRQCRHACRHARVVLSVLAHEGSGETAAVFRLGADELGFATMAILPRDQCSVAAFSEAVHQLATDPLLKPRLLKAMALAAGADGKLSPVEREIIASMAAVMDCPVTLGEAAPRCRRVPAALPATRSTKTGQDPDFPNSNPVLGFYLPSGPSRADIGCQWQRIVAQQP